MNDTGEDSKQRQRRHQHHSTEGGRGREGGVKLREGEELRVMGRTAEVGWMAGEFSRGCCYLSNLIAPAETKFLLDARNRRTLSLICAI